MTTLEEKVNSILENVGNDFNNLPFEERIRINRYISRTQILTIWQMLLKDEDLTTKRWRKKQRAWLENCVKSHQAEYGDY